MKEKLEEIRHKQRMLKEKLKDRSEFMGKLLQKYELKTNEILKDMVELDDSITGVIAESKQYIKRKEE